VQFLDLVANTDWLVCNDPALAVTTFKSLGKRYPLVPLTSDRLRSGHTESELVATNNRGGERSGDARQSVAVVQCEVT
jgi:hypothetical protein